MNSSPLNIKNLETFFTALRKSQTPALLWYSQSGERIELSGKVLDNWVSKTANYLVDECEVESGSTIDILMSTHWRSVVIALATLRCGARISWENSDAEILFSFSSRYIEESGAEYPVIVDRGPLSPRFMGTLPTGSLDYCAEVRAFGDEYSQLELPSPHHLALEQMKFDEVLDNMNQLSPRLDDEAEGFSAIHFEAPQQLDSSFVLKVLSVLATGRGIVVLDPAVDWGEPAVQRILSNERALKL